MTHPTDHDPAIDLEFIGSAYGITRERAVALALRTAAVIASYQLGRLGADPEVLVRLLHAPPLCPLTELAEVASTGREPPPQPGAGRRVQGRGRAG